MKDLWVPKDMELPDEPKSVTPLQVGGVIFNLRKVRFNICLPARAGAAGRSR